MTSAKKKRAQQHRVEKRYRLPRRDASSYLKNFKSFPPDVVVEQVRKGFDLPRLGIAQLETEEDMRYELRLINAGLIDELVQLLNQCERKLFRNVVHEGDIKTPAKWVAMLGKLLEDNPSNSEGIATKIGPFVRSMCSTRVFFNSQMFWYQSIECFIGLVWILIFNGVDEILFLYDDLFEMVIQSVLWTQWPELVGKLETYSLCFFPELLAKSAVEYISMTSLNIVHSLVIEGVDPEKTPRRDNWFLKRRSKKFLQRIGKTIIPCKVSGLDHEVPFIVAMINLLKSIPVEGDKQRGSLVDNRGRIVIADRRGMACNVISGLICADAINEDVILGIIDFGLNHLVCDGTELASDEIDFTAISITNMLSINGTEPHDARFALAMKTGLFRVILKLVVDSSQKYDGSRIRTLFREFESIAILSSCLKLTSHAIKDCRDQIESLVQEADQYATSNNKLCQDFVKMVRSFLYINGLCQASICGCCHAEIEGNQIMQCSKCRKVCYCSRACQVNHWGGHKNRCNLIMLAKFATKDMAQSAHRLLAIGQMVFEEGLPFLFMKAILQDYDILDCVAVIHLEEVPPLIDLELQSDLLSTTFSRPESLETVWTFHQSKGYLNVVYRAYDFFSSESSSAYEWCDRQSELKDALVDELVYFRENPVKKVEYLEYLLRSSHSPLPADDLNDQCIKTMKDFVKEMNERNSCTIQEE